jgi:DNA-binding NarL/FixJ family response regulator
VFLPLFPIGGGLYGPHRVKATKCLIVDDHPLYRDGLRRTLSELNGVTVCDEAESVGQALRSPEQPDVVLLDLGLPDVVGAQAVEAIREHWRESRVLVVTASELRRDLVDALGAGASGYLTKHAGPDELEEAIQTVASGRLYVTPRLASYLLEEDRLRSRDEWRLSEREREILRLVAEGERDRDIAERLHISLRTVQSHLDRIREKTGRRRRADLTRLAMTTGLLEAREE